MSNKTSVLTSADYKTELARTIGEWLPHDELIPKDAPSGFVSIQVKHIDTELVLFLVRDPSGTDQVWTISWQVLLAYGALKLSEN